MKMNQNHNRGLVKLSTLHLTSKNKSTVSTTKPTESSKYFTQQESFNTDLQYPQTSKSDSPYSDCLNEIKCVHSSDDTNDFKTPKPVRNNSKIFPKVSGTKRKTNKTRAKKSAKGNYIIKITKDNFGQTDIDPNHLQMALALSKSTYDNENPGHFEDVRDMPNFLAIEKIAKVKTTLEKYGFKSVKSKLNTGLIKDQRLRVKKPKTSKFRFITPILKTRTEEERKSLITSKISLILNENKYSQTNKLQIVEKENGLNSDFLKKLNQKRDVAFSINRLDQTDLGHFNYYNENLNISPTKYKCGCLLRNWDNIPGREKTPNRTDLHRFINIRKEDNNLEKCKDIIELNDNNINNDNPEISNSLNLSIDYNTVGNNLPNRDIFSRNSISPDLFDTDDEIHFSPKTPERYDSSSSKLLHNLLSPKRKKNLLSNSVCERYSPDFEGKRVEIPNGGVFGSNTGIVHFESFHNDLDVLSREVCILRPAEESQTTKKIHMSPLKDGLKYTQLIDLTQRLEMESTNDKPRDDNFDQLSISDDDINIGYRHKIENIQFDSKINDNMCNLIKCDLKSSAFDDMIINGSNIKIEYKEMDKKNQPKNSNKSNIEIFTLEEIVSDTSVEYDLTQYSSSDDTVGKIYNSSIKSKEKCVTLNKFCINKQVDLSIISSDDANSDCDDLTGDIQLDHKKQMNPIDSNAAKYSKTIRETNSVPGMNSSNLLNVTDYVDNLLKNDVSTSQEYSGTELCEEFTENNLSQSSCSQESIVISDEELNYSSMRSKPIENSKYPNDKASFYELSSDEDTNDIKQEETSKIANLHSELTNKYRQDDFPPVHNRITELKDRLSITRESLIRVFLEDPFTDVHEDKQDSFERKENISESTRSCEKIDQSRNQANKLQENATENVATPEKVCVTVKDNRTPENNFIIKTNDVTPMVNFDDLDTPEVNKKLQKFGLKPLKRQRGAKLLKYLYESTHPFIGPNETNEISSDEDDRRIVKKRRSPSYKTSNCNKLIKITQMRDAPSDIKLTENIALVDNLLEKINDDLIFERKFSAKISSCQIPLQIVWHNFVCSNPDIEENILMYEPLQLEVLHCMLKEQSGCKFHLQDLTTFLDKKCVTIRTSQKQEGKRKN